MSDDLDIQRLAKRLRDPLQGWGFIVPGQGTYAPTYLGDTTAGATTYTTQAGFYVRLGRIVIAWGLLVWTAATGTGNARVSLPFPVSATTNTAFSGTIDMLGVTFANSTPTPEMTASVTGFIMRSPLTNANGAVVAIEAAGTLAFTIVYAID